jgi:hypothetical protein
VRAGWPVRVEGYASGVVFGGDHGVYVTAVQNTTGTTRIIAFDRDGGTVLASDVLQAVATSAWTGAGPGAPTTVVAADGTAFVLSESAGRAVAYGMGASGQVMPGWPYRADAGLQWQGTCSSSDTGCGLWLAAPVVGPGDVLHLPLAASATAVGGSLAAIGRDGRMRPGWPVVLQGPGAAFWRVVVGQDGTAYAVAMEHEATGTSATIVAIAPDGTIAYRTTVVEP